MLLESVEALAPVPAIRGQPCVHLGERGGAQGVQPTSTVSADGDEPGGAEDPQVPGDTRLRDAQVTDELPHGPLTITQEIEYLPAQGVGERGERGHGESITGQLCISVGGEWPAMRR